MSHFVFFNVVILTYNIKTFISIFIPIKYWSDYMYIKLLLPSLFIYNYQQLPCVGSMPCSWIDSLLCHKNQTNWYETYMVIFTYIHLFQRINNLLIIQNGFFYEGKKSLWNGGYKNFWLVLIDLHEPWNFDKFSLMEKQCDLNTYPKPNDFFVFTAFLIQFLGWI